MITDNEIQKVKIELAKIRMIASHIGNYNGVTKEKFAILDSVEIAEGIINNYFFDEDFYTEEEV